MIKVIMVGAILGLLLSQAGVGWTTLLRDRFGIKPRRWVACLLSVIFCCVLVAASWLVESGETVLLSAYYPMLAVMLLVALPAAWFSVQTKDDKNKPKGDGQPPTA